jgi:hypothetical protein
MMAARVLLPKTEVMVREIELRIQYGGSDRGIEGLRAYEQAMSAEGLSQHTIEEMEQFLGVKLRH